MTLKTARPSHLSLLCIIACATNILLCAEDLHAQAQYQSGQIHTQPQALPTSDNLSFTDRLTNLERLNNLPPPAADASVIERLARLEVQVGGQQRHGSIIERLNILENARAQNLRPLRIMPNVPPFKESVSTSSTANTTINTSNTATISPASPASTLTAAPPSARTLAPGAMAEIIKHSHVSASIPLPDIYPPRFFHIQLASDTQTDNSDYLNAVMLESKGKVIRFQKQPIPFYITPIQEIGFNKAIREAFDDWSLRTNNLVQFSETKNKNEARIIVVFSHLGLTKDQDSLGAHTVAKWKSRGSGKLAFLPVGSIPVPLYIPAMGPKYTVPPQLIEVNLDVLYDHEEEVRLLLLKNIATHEAGHALGMLGHSPNKNDMMYGITDEHSRISQRDINTLTRLYQRKVDIPL